MTRTELGLTAEGLKLPILIELEAVGGADKLPHLYSRVKPYAGYTLELVAPEAQEAATRSFQELVRQAGLSLDQDGCLVRSRGKWAITPRGIQRVREQRLEVTPLPDPLEARAEPTHRQLQDMIAEVGRLLEHDVALEVDFYDVIWRASPVAPRFSHVFEVQVAGSVDSALTRLLQAWESQRSIPVLVVANERSLRLAQQRLEAAFHRLVPVLRVMRSSELQRLHQGLSALVPMLELVGARG